MLHSMYDAWAFKSTVHIRLICPWTCITSMVIQKQALQKKKIGIFLQGSCISFLLYQFTETLDLLLLRVLIDEQIWLMYEYLFQALIRKWAPVAIVIGVVLLLFWVRKKIW